MDQIAHTPVQVLAVDVHAVHDALVDALALLLDRADALMFRPSVDDSRKIDRDTRALRAVLEQARAALALAEKEV